MQKFATVEIGPNHQRGPMKRSLAWPAEKYFNRIQVVALFAK